jgi:hypothetical protein
VSPILGIWASQNYPRITSSYESIQTVTVGAGGSSAASFTSIPSTYKHLQIRCLVKSTSAGNDAWALSLQGYLNADTTVSNYAYHRIYGDGSTVVAGGAADAIGQLGFIPSAGLTNVFAPSIIDILDYTNTNKFTTFRAINGSDSNNVGGGYVGFQSQLWKNTAAVNAIEFRAGASGTFAQYSSFALYGIKG